MRKVGVFVMILWMGGNGGGSGLIRGGAGTRGWVVRVPGVGWAKLPRGAGARWFEVQAPGGLRVGQKFWEMQNSVDFVV